MQRELRETMERTIATAAKDYQRKGDTAGLLLTAICSTLLAEVILLSSQNAPGVSLRSAAVTPGTSEIDVTGYVAEAVWSSAPVDLSGQRLVSKSLYEIVAGQDVLREDVVILFNPATGVFSFSVAYDLPAAKLVFRTESL